MDIFYFSLAHVCFLLSLFLLTSISVLVTVDHAHVAVALELDAKWLLIAAELENVIVGDVTRLDVLPNDLT
jgi:hypothetical protein